VRVSAADVADVGARIGAARGSADGLDLVVWAEVAEDPGAVAAIARPYQEAGATWWLESARPGDGDWWDGVRLRVAAGV
jgi:hypothetical protein